ncbi:MAG: phenylalanine--tRNA ligase subunit beta [Actinobacteria bacterium]|nr:phenylalanine--tRNA ligase subunit beta [Actinomycetota bacterium]
MKVPLSWLREFVDVELELDELLERMGANGLEIETVTRPGAGVTGVRTVQVLRVEPHPDADKLVLVRVSDGTDEHEVVCGAHNFGVGDVVPHAPPGATLPGGVQLERREIRGVTSAGMLCSPRELEVAADHSGILVLPDDALPGVDIHELLPLGEPVIDVAVMADRGDHLSVVGVARDLAAILDSEHRAPAHPQPRDDGPVAVDIEAVEGCSHYVGWVVETVRIGPSPWWLRRRLEASGVRSINTVVDVTNYVALELGQPLHAFDLDRLQGDTLSVRWAAEGEHLVTLDDKDRTLLSTDLVIADARGAVALAGVMGGARSEVTDTTTRVLLEAAVFDPLTVRRTSRRLNLVSEASTRFERRVDPAGAWRGAARAVELLRRIAGATDAGATDGGEPRWDRTPVVLDTAWCAHFVGVDDLDASTQARLLERVGCEVDGDGDGNLRVIAPSWRGDLRRPADLAEEVIRLHGYDRVPTILPAIPLRGGLTRVQQAERDIRGAALAAGFHEAQTSPFVSAAGSLVPLAPGDGAVTVENPVAADARDLRPSLTEGLLGALRHNVGQGRPGAALFEYARIFRPSGGSLDDALAAFGEAWRWDDPQGRPLPTQPRVLGVAAQGVRVGDRWLDTRGTWEVQAILALFDDVVGRVAPGAVLERLQEPRPGLHPGRTAGLRLRGVEIGVVGQLRPDEAAARDLPEPVVLGELLIEPLLELVGGPPLRAPTLVRHPAVTVDVALVADDTVPFARLERAIRDGAGELLDELWVFDTYRGEQIGEGRRSVAVRLRLQAPERQLTDEDAERVIEAVAAAAEREGATLRR